MKKICLVVLALALMTGVAYAGIGEMWDNTVDYVTSRPVKGGVIYDFNDRDVLEFVGTAVVEDVAKVENLDIDTFIASNDPLNNDAISLYGGVSYTVALNEKLDLGLGAAVGTERIESFDELGEFKGGIYAYLNW